MPVSPVQPRPFPVDGSGDLTRLNRRRIKLPPRGLLLDEMTRLGPPQRDLEEPKA